MGTIGSLIIEIAGDNSRLKRAFKDSQQATAQYQGQIVTARREFASSAIRLREDVFSGALSPAAFKRQGVVAAKAYNSAVLGTIAELRGAGQLTQRLHASLVNELRDTGAESAKSFLDGMAGALTGAGGVLKSIGRTLTVGLSLPLAAGGAFAFKAASDAAEEANAFRVTFGPLADEVQGKLDNLHRTIPVTNTQLRQLASGFGALLLPMGIVPDKAAAMSTRLVELAGDIQSLRNIPFNEVIQRLTSGLVGETEAVRRLGANIGETALKAEAMRLGFGNNVTALTSAQKATAVYNILLRDTALATGDAANTMDSAANQVRFAQRNFSELAVVIGTQLLPIVTPLIARFSAWLETLKNANPDTIAFGLRVAAIAVVAGPVITALGVLASGVGTFVGWIASATAAIAGAGGLSAALTSLSGLAILGPAGIVVGLAAASIALVTWMDRMGDASRKVDDLKESVRGLSREQLVAEMNRRATSIAALQKDAMTAPLVAPDMTRAGGRDIDNDKVVRTRTQIQAAIKEESEQLKVLTARWQELTKPEADAARIAERQAAVWKQMMIDAQKIAGTNAPATDKDAATALERHLTQLVQTQSAIKAVNGDTARLDTELMAVFTNANVLLDKHGDKWDDVGLRIQEIAAKAQGAIADSIRAAAVPPALADIMKRGVPGISLTGANGPRVADIVEPTHVIHGAGPFAGAGDAAKEFVATGLAQAFRSLASQLNPLGAIVNAINNAAAPLAPVLAILGDVVARDLAPIFKAFEPVLRELIPVIDAVLRVVAPLVAALMPILSAFIPILKAFFPILKQGAIIATYLFQAFAIGASIFLRAVGNIVIGFGTIIKALATAIDKLPFVSARGAIDAAQGIIDFGKALLASSDDFKKSAEDMAKARDEIQNVEWDETAGSVSALGEAASEAADAMRNVPTWWKSAAAIWEATHARDDVWTPPDTAHLDPVSVGGGRAAVPQSLGGPGSTAVAGGGGGDVAIANINIENVTLAEPVTDARVLFRAMLREAQRVSFATFGTTARWAEVL